MCNRTQLSAALSMQAVAVDSYFPTLLLDNGYRWIIIGPAWSLVSATVGPSPKQPTLKE